MASSTAGQPADNLIVIHHQLKNDVQLVAQIRQKLLEGLGLRDRARESIEQETPRSIVLRKPVTHHFHGYSIRNEIAGIHVLLGQFAQISAFTDIGTKNVAG